MVKEDHKNWEISPFGWNGISGVYCICSNPTGKTKVHYIGSSKNIGKRVNMQSHPYRVLFNSGVEVFIKFKETSDYLSLEKRMIKRIKPEMNSQHTQSWR